jgi:kynurenine formamidase
MDAPMHFIDGGAYICDFPVGNFQQRGVVVDARGHKVIGADLLAGVDLQPNDMVLVRTDWCQHFREENYYTEYPVISPDFAHALVAAKVALIGLDTPSPDYEPFDIHKILLAADVLIIENLTNLAALEGLGPLRIHAYPMKYKAEAAPVRVVAEVL